MSSAAVLPGIEQGASTGPGPPGDFANDVMRTLAQLQISATLSQFLQQCSTPARPRASKPSPPNQRLSNSHRLTR